MSNLATVSISDKNVSHKS